MLITWYRDKGYLIIPGTKEYIGCRCDVRNEINKRRSLNEVVVRTENADGTEGVPYMPRAFPLGKWRVLAVIPKEHPYEAPKFISTDAHQKLPRWEVEGKHYLKPSTELVDDFGYGLHYSTSLTTLGCGRLEKPAYAELLSEMIKSCEAQHEDVFLEVI